MSSRRCFTQYRRTMFLGYESCGAVKEDPGTFDLSHPLLPFGGFPVERPIFPPTPRIKLYADRRSRCPYSIYYRFRRWEWPALTFRDFSHNLNGQREWVLKRFHGSTRIGNKGSISQPAPDSLGVPHNLSSQRLCDLPNIRSDRSVKQLRQRGIHRRELLTVFVGVVDAFANR